MEGIVTEKLCRRCGQTKAIECFGVDRQKADGRYPACRECRSKRALFWDTKDKYRRRTYGLEPEGYRAMLTAQGGKCAICGESSPGPHDWNVDHDHKTGRIRGLLCGRCNTGIGQFRDSRALLAAAIAYLGTT